jgi:hypothetical protein
MNYYKILKIFNFKLLNTIMEGKITKLKSADHTTKPLYIPPVTDSNVIEVELK